MSMQDMFEDLVMEAGDPRVERWTRTLADEMEAMEDENSKINDELPQMESEISRLQTQLAEAQRKTRVLTVYKAADPESTVSHLHSNFYNFE